MRFGEPQGRFWLRNEVLTTAPAHADPTAHAMYRQLCDQQLIAQQQTDSRLSDQVLSHLNLFQEHPQREMTWPRLLGMSERSFRCTLSEEGSSYRDLLAQVPFCRPAAPAAPHPCPLTTSPSKLATPKLPPSSTPSGAGPDQSPSRISEKTL